MRIQCCTNKSLSYRLSAAVALTALCAAVALAVIYRSHIPPFAKKIYAKFIKSPWKVQLPVVAAVSGLATYALLRVGSLCCSSRGPAHKRPDMFTKKDFAADISAR